MARKSKAHDPFRWFDSSPEVIQLVVMLYVRVPLSLRNVEVQANEDTAAVRRRPRQLPQPLQPVASPRQPRHLQGTTLSRSG
jgi:hypothetical protein